MTSYILRIYRRGGAAREIAGILELPEQDLRLAFRSFSELERLLSGDPGQAPLLDDDHHGDDG